MKSSKMLSRFEAGVGCACRAAEVGRGEGLGGQTRCSGRVAVVLGASYSICTACPLCPMLREKENQLLVMVSTAMPRCARGASPPSWSWQPLPGLPVACGNARWSILLVGCPSLGWAALQPSSVPPATPPCSALCRRMTRALSAQQILTSASRTMVL